LADQNVEFSDLPAGAQFTLNYVDNGVTTSSGPFGVEQTTGTKVYGSFLEPFSSYPFTFEFRIDTIVNGQVVYRSSLDVACSGDASGSAAIVNQTGPLPTTTTTSTTLPPGCPEEATAASIDCRIDVLIDEITVSTADQELREGLLEDATEARAAVAEAAGAATSRARKRALRHADKALARISGELRRTGDVSDAGRPSLLRTVAGLRSDLFVLRSTPG
jgi:hypothetical protein